MRVGLGRREGARQGTTVQYSNRQYSTVYMTVGCVSNAGLRYTCVALTTFKCAIAELVQSSYTGGRLSRRSCRDSLTNEMRILPLSRIALSTGRAHWRWRAVESLLQAWELQQMRSQPQH